MLPTSAILHKQLWFYQDEGLSIILKGDLPEIVPKIVALYVSNLKINIDEIPMDPYDEDCDDIIDLDYPEPFNLPSLLFHKAISWKQLQMEAEKYQIPNTSVSTLFSFFDQFDYSNIKNVEDLSDYLTDIDIDHLNRWIGWIQYELLTRDEYQDFLLKQAPLEILIKELQKVGDSFKNLPINDVGVVISHDDSFSLEQLRDVGLSTFSENV